MAFQLKMWFMLLVISFVANTFVSGQPQVPCLFIMGDSLVDNGNNNDLDTTAKANYPPYGIDFPDGPTGRFSNGRNIVDILAELLGFEKYIPPFANVTDHEILQGVNYGSGGAGIRDETGSQLGARISLNGQIKNHQTIVSRIAVLLGSQEAAANYLSKCIYSVNMGSNDYGNNYLVPQYYPTSRLYTPKKYAVVLNRQYSLQLKILYKLNARKIAVYGLGQKRCTPAEEATTYGKNGCALLDSINNDVQLFNDRLKSLVDHLNIKFTDAKFIYINSTSNSLEDLSAIGITVTNASCCVVSSNIGRGQCVPNQVPCSNRNLYEFWDLVHPTEIGCKLIASKIYSSMTPLLTAS